MYFVYEPSTRLKDMSKSISSTRLFFASIATLLLLLVLAPGSFSLFGIRELLQQQKKKKNNNTTVNK